jgi:tRNA-specific 2-thiouridylase
MTAEWDGAALTLTPDVPGIAAPGQAAVLYQGAQVIAGGFIRAG